MGLNFEFKEKVGEILRTTYQNQANENLLRLEEEKLSCVIAQYHPELTSDIHVPGQPFANFYLSDSNRSAALFKKWLKFVNGLVAEKQLAIDDSIQFFLKELDQLTESMKITQKITVPLLGISLEEDVEILLDSDMTLKNLSVNIKTDLAQKATNILHAVLLNGFRPSLDLSKVQSGQVRHGIFVESQMSFEFKKTDTENTHTNSTKYFLEEFDKRFENFLYALHATKSGFAEGYATMIDWEPNSLLFQLETRLIISKRPSDNWTEISISKQDIEKIKKIYYYLNNCKDQQEKVKNACLRLYLAESKSNAKDGLIDACIGIEHILHPNQTNELSFRLNMHYVFLVGDRQNSYKEMKQIQEVRGRVVHGADVSDETIKKTNLLAKSALRKIIQTIVLDEVLSKEKNSIKIFG